MVCKIISFWKVAFSLSWGHQAHLASNSPYGMRYWAGLLHSVSGVMWHLMLRNYFLTQLKEVPCSKSSSVSPHKPPCQSPRHWIYFLLCSLLVPFLCSPFSKPFPLWLKSAAGDWSMVAHNGPGFSQSSWSLRSAIPFLRKAVGYFSPAIFLRILQSSWRQPTNKQNKKQKMKQKTETKVFH